MLRKKKLLWLPLLRLRLSIILTHQPDAQGTASKPFSFSICVALYEKGSLHDPNSPLDLQLTHLLKVPDQKILFHFLR